MVGIGTGLHGLDYLVQDRNSWWEIVNTVIGFGVSIKCHLIAVRHIVCLFISQSVSLSES
jgi:hypothetical protein